jgi:hypothetical protein
MEACRAIVEPTRVETHLLSFGRDHPSVHISLSSLTIDDASGFAISGSRIVHSRAILSREVAGELSPFGGFQ